MTGGGFGGSTVSLVERAALERFAEVATVRFCERFGRRPAIFTSRAAAGARSLEVS